VTKSLPTGRNLGPRRFDVVVMNFKRLELFLSNFGKIRNYDRSRDRITIVSASPSPSELRQIREFEDDSGLSVRYLTRRNRGDGELPRAQYYTGAIGNLEENLSYAYIFQMQDHYLDTTSAASRWGPELEFRIKGDVVPDGVFFDLDRMETLARQYDLKGFFCDRNNPCFISMEGRRFVAPSGGNYVIRTSNVRGESVQGACRRLIRLCDDSPDWNLYAEFMWGPIFFQEGERFYDLKRSRLFEAWDEKDFYFAPDDFPGIKAFYDRPAPVRALVRSLQRAKKVLPPIPRRLLV
jgi:hypothetical protein